MKKVLVAYRVDRSNQGEIGIYNKMLDIVDAFKALNYQTNYICLEGSKVVVNDVQFSTQVLTRDGFFRRLTFHIINEGYDLLYLRFTPFSYMLGKEMNKLKHAKQDLKIILELPTYPFINEYGGLKSAIIKNILSRKWKIDQWADTILHLGPEKSLFNVNTIHFDNGINAKKITQKKTFPKSKNTLKLISVSKLWNWQGLDVLIDKLGKYNRENPNPKVKVFLLIIGDGKELGGLKAKVKSNHISSLVSFIPPKYGTDLDIYFEQSDLGIGVLHDLKRGFKYVSALKHRNYAARGVPFVFGITDYAFTDKKEVLKLNENFTLNKIINWYQKDIFPYYKERGDSLRQFSENELNLVNQLSKVLKELLFKT